MPSQHLRSLVEKIPQIGTRSPSAWSSAVLHGAIGWWHMKTTCLKPRMQDSTFPSMPPTAGLLSGVTRIVKMATPIAVGCVLRRWECSTMPVARTSPARSSTPAGRMPTLPIARWVALRQVQRSPRCLARPPRRRLYPILLSETHHAAAGAPLVGLTRRGIGVRPSGVQGLPVGVGTTGGKSGERSNDGAGASSGTALPATLTLDLLGRYF